MKKLLVLGLLIALGVNLNAQVIEFKDANFKKKLLQSNADNQIAKNLTGEFVTIDINDDNQIDITEALKISGLKLRNANISDLSGIEFFTNLKDLDVDDNSINQPDLSKNLLLTHLKYNSNKLGEFDVSQNINLESLECQDNRLSSLNVSNNINLKTLDCSTNGIAMLDLSNNSKLTKLNCGGNTLFELDLSMNPELTDLRLILNFMLTRLDVTSNTKLKNIYGTLTGLEEIIGIRELKELEALTFAETRVSELDLSNCPKLITLDSGNSLIKNLDVSFNKALGEFNCESSALEYLNIKNGLKGLVSLSNCPNLKYVCADKIEIEELIERNTKGSQNVEGVLISSYCTFEPGGDFYTIRGVNQDCESETVAIPNLKYKITDGRTNGIIISNEKGEYKIPVLEGSHTITPQLENPEYYTVTPSSLTVSFPEENSPSIQDFCVSPKGNIYDLEVTILSIGDPARPGFDAFYAIIYQNKGMATQSGTIELTYFDDVLDYNDSRPLNTGFGDHKLNWNFKDLKPFEKRKITVGFNVNSPQENPAVNNGDVLSFTATITSNQTDQTPNDNTHALRQTIVNSFDPNDKTCLEGNEIRPEMIGQYIHYKIRFENTGTFPAENIVVVDEIDATKFDISTIVPIDASHPYETKITGNKVEFIFQKINLPFDDANNDGYITFKIKTLSTLKLNDSFSNQASIYFDFNFPIVTNNETTTITESHLNTSEFNFNDQLNLYPNPAKDRLTIEPKNGTTIQSVTIYNLQGQLVLSIPQVSQTSFDVSNLQKGVYVVTVNTDKGATTTKLVKN